MEMRHRVVSWVSVVGVLLGGLPLAWAAPSNTMSVTPTCTSGTTILCSDETTRNNNISTPYNAHTHTDIAAMSGVNTFTIGDNTSGNKDYCVDSATDRCIRWNETAGLFTLQQAGTAYNEVATYTSTAGLTPNAVVLGNGTTALTTVSGLGTSGQVLTSNGAGTAPTFQASTALSTFVGSFTRDTSLATGTQAVTGVGFTPRALVIISFQDGAAGEASWGVVSGTSGTNNRNVGDNNGGTTDTYSVANNVFIDDRESGANEYTGALSSFDSDGFTISWTRTGTPTGTLTIQYLAIR